MKNFIKTLGMALALIVQPVYAVPTLFFDGDMSYGASSGALSVVSVLTATQEINPSPELMGSSLTFSTSLTGVNVSSSIRTIGLFSSGTGDNISVTDGDSNNLLFGEFTSLSIMGRNNRSSGRITGTMSATTGLLESYFGEGQLIALVFNIDSVFSADMFDNSFAGNVDGRIVGQTLPVPAPGIFTLFWFGLILMGIKRIHARHI